MDMQEHQSGPGWGGGAVPGNESAAGRNTKEKGEGGLPPTSVKGQ